MKNMQMNVWWLCAPRLENDEEIYVIQTKPEENEIAYLQFVQGIRTNFT